MTDVLAREHARGVRGTATRAALLAALAGLLESTPWRDVEVRAVARTAGVGFGTFYQYFRGVEHAVRDLVDDLDGRREPIPPHLVRVVDLMDWEAKHLPEVAR